MGPSCIDLRSYVDAAWHLSRSDTSCIPRWRFEYQYHHAINAVLSTRGRVLSALCEKYRNRNSHGYDAALFSDLSHYLDDIPATVYTFGSSIRHSIELHLPIIKNHFQICQLHVVLTGQSLADFLI